MGAEGGAPPEGDGQKDYTEFLNYKFGLSFAIIIVCIILLHEIFPQGRSKQKKNLCSYVTTMFRFLFRFARVGILSSRPVGSREVLVSVSEFF